MENLMQLFPKIIFQLFYNELILLEINFKNIFWLWTQKSPLVDGGL